MPDLLPLLALPLATMLQMGMALWMFALPLPRREGYAWHVATIALLTLVGAVVATWVGFVAMPELTGRLGSVTLPLVFQLVFIVMPFVVLWCRDTSIWTALWCASAAYSMQNLASGTGELLLLLADASGESSSGAAFVAFLVGWVVVFAVCWLLLVRRLWKDGAYEVKDRRMLGMLLLVLLLVIGLDVLIKNLTAEGVLLSMLVTLRIMHGSVCLFFLSVSYELLFSWRLRSEVATLRALTEERERQYALSRETFAAVNARVHDMRHQVLRSLEAGSDTPLDRSLLAEVAREMDVYDLVVRTGCEALDTAVTERALLCQREDIELMCMADGSALLGFPPADVYRLVGGMLDVAIGGAREAGSKGVDLTVRRRGEMVVVHVEWEGAAPSSSQLGALRSVAERHGGTIAAGTREGVARLNALLPAG